MVQVDTTNGWKSKNRGTPKWMVKNNGKPYQNGWFGGVPPFIFGNIQREMRSSHFQAAAANTLWKNQGFDGLVSPIKPLPSFITCLVRHPTHTHTPHISYIYISTYIYIYQIYTHPFLLGKCTPWLSHAKFFTDVPFFNFMNTCSVNHSTCLRR